MTYFVDEEGRYYYQSAGDSENLVSLQTDENEENEEVLFKFNLSFINQKYNLYKLCYILLKVYI